MSTWPSRCLSPCRLLAAAVVLLGLLSGCGNRQGTVVWQVKPGLNYATPPILFNRVLYAASGDMILALDPQTGKKIWEQQVLGGTDVPPLVTNDYLLIASNTGALHRLDRKTGKRAWHFETLQGSLATPSLGADRVFLVTRARLWAVNLHNGKPIWSLPLARPRLMAPVRGKDGLIYMGTAFELLAIEPGRGRVRQRIKVDGESVAPPVVLGNNIVNLAGNGYLQGFAFNGRREGWHVQLHGPAVLPMLTDRSVIYVPAGQELSAVETAVPAWTYRAPGMLRAPVVADNYYIFVVARNGGIHAIDKLTGAERWQSPIPDNTYAVALAAHDGIVYLSYREEGGKGGAQAVAALDGRLLWRRSFPGGVRAAPVADQQTAYLGTVSGELLAIKP